MDSMLVRMTVDSVVTNDYQFSLQAFLSAV